MPIIKSRKIAENLNDLERKETLVLAGGIKVQVRLYHTEEIGHSFWSPMTPVLVWKIKATDEGVQLCRHSYWSNHTIQEEDITFPYNDYDSALAYFNKLIQKYRGQK